MGYGDLSMTGHPTIDTPNIDRLGREGMFFTNWYSGFHLCSPSRASLLTGRLPPRTGCAGSWHGGVFPANAVSGFPDNETTFADQLKERGYATGVLGKWHLGQREKYLPFNRGFDEWLGIPYSVDMGSSPWMDQKPKDPVLALIDNATILEQPVNLNGLTEKYGLRANEFITKSVESKQPFVLYMAFSHVHRPNFASGPFCNSSARGRFGDAMSEMDWLVGNIMASIEINNISTNTLTFFTSDNGVYILYLH